MPLIGPGPASIPHPSTGSSPSSVAPAEPRAYASIESPPLATEADPSQCIFPLSMPHSTPLAASLSIPLAAETPFSFLPALAQSAHVLTLSGSSSVFRLGSSTRLENEHLELRLPPPLDSSTSNSYFGPATLAAPALSLSSLS